MENHAFFLCWRGEGKKEGMGFYLSVIRLTFPPGK